MTGILEIEIDWTEIEEMTEIEETIEIEEMIETEETIETGEMTETETVGREFLSIFFSFFHSLEKNNQTCNISGN